jgi:tRNA threonylcarbamoyladenosine biosynthesis protein TsaB
MTTVSMTAAVNEGAARKTAVGKRRIVPNAHTLHRLTPERIRPHLPPRWSGRIRAMQILALDTSTEVCAVALGDGVTWHEKSELAGQRHSALLLPMIQAILAECGVTLKQIDGIAFGAGPGSFTGLRIACGVAQGLALGAALPVVGVSTLEAMAQTRRDLAGGERIIAALDARMREVYVAAYERDSGRWREVIAPVVVSPAVAPVPEGRGWIAAGSGFAAYPSLRERYGEALSECDGTIVPSASAVGKLALPLFAAGEGVPARDAAPLYVRHRVALTIAERAAGLRQ